MQDIDKMVDELLIKSESKSILIVGSKKALLKAGLSGIKFFKGWRVIELQSNIGFDCIDDEKIYLIPADTPLKIMYYRCQ